MFTLVQFGKTPKLVVAVGLSWVSIKCQENFKQHFEKDRIQNRVLCLGANTCDNIKDSYGIGSHYICR